MPDPDVAMQQVVARRELRRDRAFRASGRSLCRSPGRRCIRMASIRCSTRMDADAGLARKSFHHVADQRAIIDGCSPSVGSSSSSTSRFQTERTAPGPASAALRPRSVPARWRRRLTQNRKQLDHPVAHIRRRARGSSSPTLQVLRNAQFGEQSAVPAAHSQYRGFGDVVRRQIPRNSAAPQHE